MGYQGGEIGYSCDKCDAERISPFPLMPPYGSLRANEDVILCSVCRAELVRMVHAWLGKAIPWDSWVWERVLRD